MRFRMPLSRHQPKQVNSRIQNNKNYNKTHKQVPTCFCAGGARLEGSGKKLPNSPNRSSCPANNSATCDFTCAMANPSSLYLFRITCEDLVRTLWGPVYLYTSHVVRMVTWWVVWNLGTMYALLQMCEDVGQSALSWWWNNLKTKKNDGTWHALDRRISGFKERWLSSTALVLC